MWERFNSIEDYSRDTYLLVVFCYSLSVYTFAYVMLICLFDDDLYFRSNQYTYVLFCSVKHRTLDKEHFSSSNTLILPLKPYVVGIQKGYDSFENP